MKRTFFTGTVLMVILFFVAAGCDVSVNPLVFDGSPISTRIEIDTEQNTFEYSNSINLNAAVVDFDDVVDSISVYNVTLKVENRLSPSAETPFNAYLYIDDVKLADINGLTFAAFESEQSLFTDELLEYITINLNSVESLSTKLAQSPLPTVNVKVAGNVEEGPLTFDLLVTLYTQVYTTP